MEKLYWDAIQVGDVYWGDEVVADPEEMLEYARRNDPQPVHLDEEAAKNTIFGGIIASGGFTVTLWYRSCIPQLAQLAILTAIEWTIRLPAPVKPHDRLRVRTEVMSKRPSSKPGRGYAEAFQEMFNQDDTIVFTCKTTWMMQVKTPARPT